MVGESGIIDVTVLASGVDVTTLASAPVCFACK